jgi:hypothetical protein
VWINIVIIGYAAVVDNNEVLKVGIIVALVVGSIVAVVGNIVVVA